MPESARWQQLQLTRPHLYEEVYQQIGAPVIHRPYSNSGVFLTPIDFRVLPDLPLARMARIAIPAEAIDADRSSLTYELEGRRLVLPVSAATLAETARLWPEPVVRQWFGRIRNMLFYHLPQVAVYVDEGIRVLREWVEPC
ncbi:MAG: hypothetical protein ACYC5Y_14670 [Symbiobacteriia bacterium]